MEQAALDPNLPAAFKVANSKRLAFAKQQARRKNNDTFVSLNSTHVGKDSMSQLTQTEYEEYLEGNDSDDDSSFASMAGGDDDDEDSASYFEEIVEGDDENDEDD